MKKILSGCLLLCSSSALAYNCPSDSEVQKAIYNQYDTGYVKIPTEYGVLTAKTDAIPRTTILKGLNNVQILTYPTGVPTPVEVSCAYNIVDGQYPFIPLDAGSETKIVYYTGVGGTWIHTGGSYTGCTVSTATCTFTEKAK